MVDKEGKMRVCQLKAGQFAAKEASQTQKTCAGSPDQCSERTCAPRCGPFSVLFADGLLFEESSVFSACFDNAVTCCSNSEILHSAVAAR